MYYSLKFILIIILFYCQRSSSMEELDTNKAKSSEVDRIIEFCIAGGILVALLVLMGVFICFYYKIASTLKLLKELLCLALKKSGKFTEDKVAAATALTARSYPNLQSCEECRLHIDFDDLPPCTCNDLPPCYCNDLPPCCCDVNEGL